MWNRDIRIAMALLGIGVAAIAGAVVVLKWDFHHDVLTRESA